MLFGEGAKFPLPMLYILFLLLIHDRADEHTLLFYKPMCVVNEFLDVGVVGIVLLEQVVGLLHKMVYLLIPRVFDNIGAEYTHDAVEVVDVRLVDCEILVGSIPCTAEDIVPSVVELAEEATELRVVYEVYLAILDGGVVG